MKEFTNNGNPSSFDIVHMKGDKDKYTISENAGTLTYESTDLDRRYIVSEVEEFEFRYNDNQGKLKFKWDEEYSPFESTSIKIIDLSNISINGNVVQTEISNEAKNILSNIENYTKIRIVKDITQTGNSCGYPHSTQLSGSLYSSTTSYSGEEGIFSSGTGHDETDYDEEYLISEIAPDILSYLKQVNYILFNKHFWSGGSGSRSGCKSGTIHSFQVFVE